MWTIYILGSGDHGRTAGKNLCWIGALESKGLKVNLLKAKIMVSKIGPVTVRPMVNAVLCKSC